MDYKKLYEKSLKERVADEKLIAQLKEEKSELQEIINKESWREMRVSATKLAKTEMLKINRELKEEKEDLLKFIAGNYDAEPSVKKSIQEYYNQEFIDSNAERWDEVGLEFDH